MLFVKHCFERIDRFAEAVAGPNRLGGHDDDDGADVHRARDDEHGGEERDCCNGGSSKDRNIDDEDRVEADTHMRLAFGEVSRMNLKRYKQDEDMIHFHSLLTFALGLG